MVSSKVVSTQINSSVVTPSITVSGISYTLQNKTVTPSATTQTITKDAGYYALGTVTVNTDTDLIATNIKKDINIFGVVGSYEPAEIDFYNKITENGTTYANLFDGKDLIVAPSVDTSNGTDFSYMFEDCTNLITAPAYNLGNAIYLTGMFCGCTGLINLPSSFDTAKATNTSEMFYNCNKLVSSPTLNISNVVYTGSMFYNCSELVTVPQLNMNKATSVTYMFKFCTKLVNLDIINLGVNLDLSACPLSHDSLMNVINGAKTVVGKTLTLGATNLAKLSIEEKAVATDKGWTLA